jgi:hypothetical protein
MFEQDINDFFFMFGANDQIHIERLFFFFAKHLSVAADQHRISVGIVPLRFMKHLS